MKSFRELTTWQKAHKLTVAIYKVTDDFPATDNFGLSAQLQRAALSVTSNIAEGFGRQTTKDTLWFYVLARGSLTELENQIILAKDIDRINAKQYTELNRLMIEVRKLLSGLIRSTKKRLE